MATIVGVGVERSAPAIRAALVEHAPGDVARFEADLRAALTKAAEDLDLARVAAVLDRWHALAVMAANPLTASEATQLARARTGDVSGLRQRGTDGTWTTT
jgi:hypothetical protein